jgi:hypothetical protein
VSSGVLSGNQTGAITASLNGGSASFTIRVNKLCSRDTITGRHQYVHGNPYRTFALRKQHHAWQQQFKPDATENRDDRKRLYFHDVYRVRGHLIYYQSDSHHHRQLE